MQRTAGNPGGAREGREVRSARALLETVEDVQSCMKINDIIRAKGVRLKGVTKWMQ